MWDIRRFRVIEERDYCTMAVLDDVLFKSDWNMYTYDTLSEGKMTSNILQL